MYEGYGPSGVALLIECLTDNKNRAAAEVRTLMTRNGGTMADPGSVAYNFHRKGVISITKTDGVTEDDILLAVMDAGAEDVADQGGGFEVITDPVAAGGRAHRARRRPGSTTTRQRRSSCRPCRSRSMPRPRARCSA